jgi:hypothetical protein
VIVPPRGFYRSRILDWSGGVVGGVSEMARRPNYARTVDNLIPRPKGAWTARPGSRRRNPAALAKPPHTLMEWVAAGGSNKVFVATGGGSPVVYEDTGTAYTAQTWPYTPSAEWMIADQLNAALFAVQQSGTEKPAFYRSTNPANTWLTSVLPKPAAAPTFAADTALTGGVTPGAHYYRVRWQYRDGSSLSGPVSAVHTVVATVERVNLNANLQPGSPRSDFLGWRLERTKVGGSAAGPFYVVADDLTSATTYADSTPDENLYYEAQETIHAEPPHMDGIIAHKDRLFGRAGSTLYASQLFDDLEGTGLNNWYGLNAYNFGKDDGDAIQTVERQADRLIVIKQRSVWALEGNSVDSFSVVPLYKGMGGSGARCAASAGLTLWFFGDTGLYRLSGNSLTPFGWPEVGHYVDTISPASVGDVKMLNYKGQYLLIAYSTDGVANNETLVFDLRFGVWTHWTEWKIADMLMLASGTFLFTNATQVTNANDVSNNGSFVTWSDDRSGTPQTYVQKFDRLGHPAWGADGVATSLTNLSPTYATQCVLADGEGGCFVAWSEKQSGGALVLGTHIYVQHYDANGEVVWSAPGVLVASGAVGLSGRLWPGLCTDGAGGCIVSWHDDRGVGLNEVVCVQRVSAAGVALWTANGVVLGAPTTTPGFIAADGAGGAYVAWTESTNPKATRVDSSGAAVAGWVLVGNDVETAHASSTVKGLVAITGGVAIALDVTVNSAYAQKMTTAGVRDWGAGGIDLNPGSATDQQGPWGTISDGAGGVIFVWNYRAAVASNAVRASRLDSAGVKQWGADGVGVVSSVSAQDTYTGAVQDGAGGVIVAWRRGASSARDIMASRLDSAGVRLWGAAGVVVCAATGDQDLPTLCTDGAGGVIACWYDPRSAPAHIFIQRVIGAGTVAWTANGLPVSPNGGNQAQVSSAIPAQAIAFWNAPLGGVPPADANGYVVWIGMDGLLDFRASNSTGGVGIPIAVGTDWIDDGEPDVVKDFSRLETYARSNGMTLLATLTLDEAGLSATVSVPLAAAGTKWGTKKWGTFKWASSEREATVALGLPEGLKAKRYRLRYSGVATEEFVFKGFTLDATRQPERPY